ncbi:bacteriophage protein [Komagataeibacter diospyri]|uniref:phage baseplate assembly protein domain-containing protein n=1 Tax=Komagataeibacter diospyri TaxID=1932662 RepID=UPI0011389CDF|nr:phage baseplate assembly protein [Komagataeibacter diospyri]GCE89694.1 bacteriophage protein [Komagataeibacter diospyri]
MAHSYADRLFRRLQGLFQIGRISTPPDDTGTVQTGQVTINGTAIRDGVPIIQDYGFSAVLPVGSDAIVLNVSGDASNGVVIRSIHKASRPKGLKNGQVCLFDMAGNQVLLTNGNGISVTPQSGQPITLNGKTVINGPLEVSDDATIGGIGFLEHLHGGVQSGGSNTEKPQS